MVKRNMRRIVVLQFVAGMIMQAQSVKGLGSAGPAPNEAPMMRLFGQFAGDWECQTTLIGLDGSRTKGTCEWHFGYVLQGHAVQDILLARYGNPGSEAEVYATTIRFYDAKRDNWWVTYVDPSSSSVKRYTATQVGSEIVQEGRSDDGHAIRCIFSEITPRSFLWRSLESADSGKTWALRQETSVRRLLSDREAIQKLEEEWLNAEGDPSTLEWVLAEDFIHPVPQGITLTKRLQVDWVSKHPGPPDRVKRFEKLEVRIYGEVAIANGIVEDTNRSGGDSHRTIFTDVFAYRNGRWQAVNAQENAIDRDK